MPVYHDDVVVNGDTSLSDQIRYYASYLAIIDLGVDSHLTGEPPIFTPLAVSPVVMVEFFNLFAHSQATIASALTHASQ